MARRSSSSWRSYGSCSVELDPKMSPMHHCVPSMSMLCIYTYVCTHIPIPIYYFYPYILYMHLHMCMCDFRSDLAPTFLCCLVLAEAVCILARSFVRKHQSNNIHEHPDQKRHRSEWKQPKNSASCVASRLAGLRMATPLNTLTFTVAYLASKWGISTTANFSYIWIYYVYYG